RDRGTLGRYRYRRPLPQPVDSPTIKARTDADHDCPSATSLHRGVANVPMGNHSQHPNPRNAVQMCCERRLLSHLREIFETLRKAVPVTYLFQSYMEPLSYVSRGKTGEDGTGKRDYRHRATKGKPLASMTISPYCPST